MEGEDCNAGAELFLQRRVGEMIAILNGGWRSVPCRRGVTRREVGNAGRSRLKASPHLKAIVDSTPAECQGHPHFQSLSRSRIDPQNPTLSTLALNQTRTYRHDCFRSIA